MSMLGAFGRCAQSVDYVVRWVNSVEYLALNLPFEIEILQICENERTGVPLVAGDQPIASRSIDSATGSKPK